MPDLDLVTTDELLEAVFARFEFAQFIGANPAGGDGTMRILRHYSGDTYPLLGLIMEAVHELLHKHAESSKLLDLED